MGRRYATNRKLQMVEEAVSQLENGSESNSRHIRDLLFDMDTVPKHYIPSTHFIGHALGQHKGVTKKSSTKSTIWVKKK
mgnify:FL=1